MLPHVSQAVCTCSLPPSLHIVGSVAFAYSMLLERDLLQTEDTQLAAADLLADPWALVSDLHFQVLFKCVVGPFRKVVCL